MTTLNFILLQASGGMNMIFLLAMVAVMYFLMLRPQMKKQKEQKAFNEGVKVGDKIVTIGGIHGKISAINADGTLKLDCDRNTYMTIETSAISMEMTAAFNKRNPAPTV
jgi:preprotein translocase subunit YajC